MTIVQLGGGALVVLGILGAGLLAWPAIRRTGLGVIHPAVAWLALHLVFFGVGAVTLELSGDIGTGTAWYVAGAALAVGLGVAVSDRVALRRGGRGVAVSDRVALRRTDAGGAAGGAVDAPATAGNVRPLVALLLVGAGLLAIAPSLLANGLPLLSDDPTAARSEIAGLSVQLIRVFLPAAAAAALVAGLRRPAHRERLLLIGTLGVAFAFTLLLASRYLAAELAAVLLVAWLLAGRRLPLRALVSVAVAGVLAFGAIQVVRAPALSQGREVAFAFERTISRVLLVQPRTVAALQAAIPAEEPYFLGLTWLRRLGPVVGRDDIPNLGYWIYPRIFPGQDPSIAGYAAPGLIGEAWANFGPLGLALFGGLGVLLERLGTLLRRRRRAGDADLAAGAVTVVILARTHALGLNGTLVLLVVLAAWRLLAGRGIRDLVRDGRAVLTWRG
jgi:hypothetical protein